jgi:RNA polymerase sigma-70 factor (ECF subfamily)
MQNAELRGLIAGGAYDRALERLHEAYRDDIARHVALRIASDAVDDVCQDIWAAARDALPRFQLDCSPRVWLRAIARHKLIDAYRRRDSHDTLDSELAGLDAVGARLGIEAPTTPTARLHREARAAALRAALAGLTPEERELIALRYVEDLKPAEIVRALALDDSANAVSQRIVRLVKRLRKELHRHEAFASASR